MHTSVPFPSFLPSFLLKTPLPIPCLSLSGQTKNTPWIWLVFLKCTDLMLIVSLAVINIICLPGVRLLFLLTCSVCLPCSFFFLRQVLRCSPCWPKLTVLPALLPKCWNYSVCVTISAWTK